MPESYSEFTQCLVESCLGDHSLLVQVSMSACKGVNYTAMTIEALVPRIVATGFVLLCVFSGAADQGLAESSGAALGRQGWEAIRAGQIAEAARLFHDAIAENAHDATLFLGAGLAAHLQGQEIEARAALQEAVRLNPKLTAAALLLGDISYRLGDLETAVRTYETALEVEPTNAHIRGRLESWRKEAALHSRFQQSLSPHFTVLFEGPAEQRLAGAAIEALEKAYWRIGTTLLAYPSGVITVVLYTEEQFRDITRSPSWPGGVFDGKIRVPLQGGLTDPQHLAQ